MDLTDSKFTSDGLFCKFGGHAFVLISWACWKQTVVSHSSTKAEVIFSNAVPRMEGVLALICLDTVVDVMSCQSSEE